MNSLTSLPLADVLDRIARPTPAPGGGAAAAIAGALGASVGAMVASLPHTRHDTPDERTRLDLAARDLSAHRVVLARLADDDAAAVTALMAAIRRPKGTPEELESRRRGIAEAVREATRVPLEISRVCSEALERTREVAAAGARVATSDVFVAVGLLKAAADGAASNVRANINGLPDETFVRETTRQLTRTLDQVARAAHASIASLQD